MAPRRVSNISNSSTISSDGSDTPLSGVVKRKRATKRNSKTIPTTPQPTSVSQSTTQSIPIDKCPYNILYMKRSEAQRADFPEILEQCMMDAHDDLVKGLRPKNPATHAQISWAYNILSNNEKRAIHESCARATNCFCISAWERLSDAEQAFLIKNQDQCHNVPAASNPYYNHSKDFQIEDTDRSTWHDEDSLAFHHEFVEAFDTIWEKYDRYCEEDQPHFCANGGPNLPPSMCKL